MPKPSALPRWANLAVNPAEGPQNITEPPDASKDTGWALGKPRRDWANWLAKTVYDWFAWLQDAPPSFETCHAALDPDTGLAEDEVGVIVPTNRFAAPWSVAWYKTATALGFTGTPELHCANDTHAILYRSAENKLVAVDLRDGSVAWSKSVSWVSSGKFCTDGLYVYGCNAAVIIRWTLRTGALDTDWNSSGPGFASTLDQVVTDGAKLYGRLNNGDIQAMTIGASDASTAWTNTDLNGITLYDLACNGSYVAICADYGGPPATFHVFRADTGVAITVTSGSGTVTMHGVCAHPRGWFTVGEQDLWQAPRFGYSGSTRRTLTRAWATHGDNTGIDIDADGEWLSVVTSNGAADYEWSLTPIPTSPTAGAFSSGGSAPLMQAALLGAGSALSRTILTPELALCLGVGGADWTAASTVLTALSRPTGPRLVRRTARTELGRSRFDRLLEVLTPL